MADATRLFPLLSLPYEIRYRIYTFALTPTERVGLYRHLGGPLEPWSLHLPSHFGALLRVNRQINREATRLFYHDNHWEVSESVPEFGPEELFTFLDSFGPINTAMLSKLTLAFPHMERYSPKPRLHGYSEEVFEILQQRCTGLERLHGHAAYDEQMTFFVESAQFDAEYANNAILLIDEHLRAIPSLRVFCVELVGYKLHPRAAAFMRERGWETPAENLAYL